MCVSQVHHYDLEVHNHRITLIEGYAQYNRFSWVKYSDGSEPERGARKNNLSHTIRSLTASIFLTFGLL